MLRQVKDAKLSLLKCLKMRKFEVQRNHLVHLFLVCISCKSLHTLIYSLKIEESKASESTSVPGSKRKEIIVYAQLFAPEEHKYSEQPLMPNTEMDEIIALAQSITRKESPSEGTRFGFEPRNDYYASAFVHQRTKQVKLTNFKRGRFRRVFASET